MSLRMLAGRSLLPTTRSIMAFVSSCASRLMVINGFPAGLLPDRQTRNRAHKPINGPSSATAFASAVVLMHSGNQARWAMRAHRLTVRFLPGEWWGALIAGPILWLDKLNSARRWPVE